MLHPSICKSWRYNSPTSGVDQSVYFACGLRAAEFDSDTRLYTSNRCNPRLSSSHRCVDFNRLPEPCCGKDKLHHQASFLHFLLRNTMIFITWTNSVPLHERFSRKLTVCIKLIHFRQRSLRKKIVCNSMSIVLPVAHSLSYDDIYLGSNRPRMGWSIYSSIHLYFRVSFSNFGRNMTYSELGISYFLSSVAFRERNYQFTAASIQVRSDSSVALPHDTL
jgi:hypothetical protein